MARSFKTLLASGLADSSVVPYLASLSVFFAWCMRERLIGKNPVTGVKVPDLRHTAACLWLSRGVEPGTVQAWCGHESIATTNRYLHFLGTDADKAGLNKLNDGLGNAGGTHDAVNGA